ncbi:hypothetical protein K466DRAFT_8446 [Polyporus arcularius HHB13444]|uniref:Uncharacterized protein n=1 Tax=Polyporus arcularius HHB13444 TaxID=1314778 RepID=A0A5C3PJY0_9APHY|nr:hypothetical protein K466DRAFT_8446 [Polyporus arcularius HHB13444]
MTTPNMTWVPKFAPANSEITAYTDGRWGLHEYSRWPQAFTRSLWHIHCIPAHPRSPGPGKICWRTFRYSDWIPDRGGIPDHGFLELVLQSELLEDAHTVLKLYEVAHLAANRYEEQDKGKGEWLLIGHHVAVSLRHCMDRLRILPAEDVIVIGVAAHIQRLILELYGMIEWLSVVRVRVDNGTDHRTDILDVLGAHTADPLIAMMLHRLGIPVWFEQHHTRNGRPIEVYKLIEISDIPSEFSRVLPSMPRLASKPTDVTAVGEWEYAASVTRQKFCGTRLPPLLDPVAHTTLPPARQTVGLSGVHHSSSVGVTSSVPSSKRRRDDLSEGKDSSSIGVTSTPPSAKRRRDDLSGGVDSSSVGAVVKVGEDIRSLGHNIPPNPMPPLPCVPTSRRARVRAAKRAEAEAAATGKPGEPLKLSLVEPYRQFYPSQNVGVSDVWAMALTEASPLPPLTGSVKYYFPPPWLFDQLVGYIADTKQGRYIHHWLSIRTFCRTRLFVSSFRGRPLCIPEWRHAVWGHYEFKEAANGASVSLGKSSDKTARKIRTRHDRRVSLCRLFGQVASLPSYREEAQHKFGNTIVTAKTAADNRALRQRVVFDVHETNRRCELLSLDTHVTASEEMSELARYRREALVSRVWGSGTSCLDIMPEDNTPTPNLWRLPPEPGWEEGLPNHVAFLAVVSRWDRCPDVLLRAANVIPAGDEEKYRLIMRTAVDFYILEVNSTRYLCSPGSGMYHQSNLGLLHRYTHLHTVSLDVRRPCHPPQPLQLYCNFLQYVLPFDCFSLRPAPSRSFWVLLRPLLHIMLSLVLPSYTLDHGSLSDTTALLAIGSACVLLFISFAFFPIHEVAPSRGKAVIFEVAYIFLHLADFIAFFVTFEQQFGLIKIGLSLAYFLVQPLQYILATFVGFLYWYHVRKLSAVIARQASMLLIALDIDRQASTTMEGRLHSHTRRFAHKVSTLEANCAAQSERITSLEATVERADVHIADKDFALDQKDAVIRQQASQITELKTALHLALSPAADKATDVARTDVALDITRPAVGEQEQPTGPRRPLEPRASARPSAEVLRQRDAQVLAFSRRSTPQRGRDHQEAGRRTC